MRYRLVALLIVFALGPPLLAWAWLRGREREQWGFILAALLFGVAASLIVLVCRGDLHWSILEDRQR